jgi:hypothetical protein
MIRQLIAYLLAIVVAYLCAVVVATQSVVASLNGMGVTVSFGDRIEMTLQDLAGMAGIFLPVIAAGFLIAFLVAALLVRWLGQRRDWLFILAGAVALVMVHLVLKLAFGITPIAVGRTTGGLLMQGLAGAAGAYVFTLLIRKPRV